MDIRYIQKYQYIPESDREKNFKCGHKYEYIPRNVRKSDLKCENYQAQMKERYTNFQRRSMKQEKGQKNSIGTAMNEMVDGCHE